MTQAFERWRQNEGAFRLGLALKQPCLSLSLQRIRQNQVTNAIISLKNICELNIAIFNSAKSRHAKALQEQEFYELAASEFKTKWVSFCFC